MNGPGGAAAAGAAAELDGEQFTIAEIEGRRISQPIGGRPPLVAAGGLVGCCRTPAPGPDADLARPQAAVRQCSAGLDDSGRRLTARYRHVAGGPDRLPARLLRNWRWTESRGRSTRRGCR